MAAPVSGSFDFYHIAVVQKELCPRRFLTINETLSQEARSLMMTRSVECSLLPPLPAPQEMHTGDTAAPCYCCGPTPAYPQHHMSHKHGRQRPAEGSVQTTMPLLWHVLCSDNYASAVACERMHRARMACERSENYASAVACERMHRVKYSHALGRFHPVSTRRASLACSSG